MTHRATRAPTLPTMALVADGGLLRVRLAGSIVLRLSLVLVLTCSLLGLPSLPPPPSSRMPPKSPIAAKIVVCPLSQFRRRELEQRATILSRGFHPHLVCLRLYPLNLQDEALCRRR